MKNLFAVFLGLAMTYAVPVKATTEKTVGSQNLLDGKYLVTVSNKGTLSVLEVSSNKFVFKKDLIKFLHKPREKNLDSIKTAYSFDSEPNGTSNNPRPLFYTNFALQGKNGRGAKITLFGVVNDGKSQWLLTGGLDWSDSYDFLDVQNGIGVCGLASISTPTGYISNKGWQNISDENGNLTKFVFLHQRFCESYYFVRVLSLVDTESMKVVSSAFMKTCGNSTYAAFGVSYKGLGMTNLDKYYSDSTSCESTGDYDFDLVNLSIRTVHNDVKICGQFRCQ